MNINIEYGYIASLPFPFSAASPPLSGIYFTGILFPSFSLLPFFPFSLFPFSPFFPFFPLFSFFPFSSFFPLLIFLSHWFSFPFLNSWIFSPTHNFPFSVVCIPLPLLFFPHHHRLNIILLNCICILRKVKRGRKSLRGRWTGDFLLFSTLSYQSLRGGKCNLILYTSLHLFN